MCCHSREHLIKWRFKIIINRNYILPEQSMYVGCTCKISWSLIFVDSFPTIEWINSISIVVITVWTFRSKLPADMSYDSIGSIKKHLSRCNLVINHCERNTHLVSEKKKKYIYIEYIYLNMFFFFPTKIPCERNTHLVRVLITEITYT